MFIYSDFPKNKTPIQLSAQAMLLFLSVLFGFISTHADSTVKTGEIVVKQNVYQILDKDLIKISFKEGSAELTNESLTALADFTKATRNESKIDRYIVASWSDRNYPIRGEVSKDQRKLAELRADHIKGALAGAGAANVDTFEMTKRPNWIQRAFSTETAEIKDKGINLTANQRLLKEIGKRLRDEGGPSTAVVVAKFKNEVSTR